MTKKPLVLAPLFDRLTDADPYSSAESPVYRGISIPQLRTSVEEEVERLFNTRHSRIPYPNSTLDQEDPEDYEIPYGLPDFSKYDIVSPEGRYTIEQDLVKLVELYEPRIKEVDIYLEQTAGPNKQVICHVSGILAQDPLQERFTFPIHLEKVELAKTG